MNAKQIVMTIALGGTINAVAQQAELLSPERLWEMGRIGSAVFSPEGKLLYSVTHYSKKQNRGTSRIWEQQPDGTRRQVAQGSSPAYLPDGRVAFLRGSNLYVGQADGSSTAVIAEGVDDFRFSPDGARVILVRMVPMHESIAAKEADLPEASGMVINDLMYKHWDHYVSEVPHPFVADYDGTGLTNEADILDGEPFECPMEPFGGVEQLAWSPDGKTIAYTCRKKTGRDYAISTDSDIYLYDVVKKRTVRNLCKDGVHDIKTYDTDFARSLEHQQVNRDASFPGYDQDPQFSPDGRYVAWLSMERDGYESDRLRLCVFDLKKGTHRFVTESFESGVDNFVWAPDSKTLYFCGVWHGRTNVYRTNVDGNVAQLTDDVADYSICGLSADGKQLLLKRHSMQYPDDLYALSVETASRAHHDLRPIAQRLTDVNAGIYRTLAVGDVKERWVKTTDGKDMLCWVIYPPQFDSTKKYPALLFCEGGPQSPVSQFWSYRWNFQIMAANGYIIIAPNRRGLPGFGMEWLEAISGDYTGQCMQDYLSAIDDLCKENYVDAGRLGAVGASFGGFSVYWLAGHHNGRFKALIAHDGIYNTQQQYVETEEMWFPNWDLGSAPWLKAADGQMQKAYRESPHLYVDKWTAPILCIHGQRDFRIEYTQAESAFTAARMRGLDAQLLLFPDENHWVLKPQNGILWQRTFFRFLDKYLK